MEPYGRKNKVLNRGSATSAGYMVGRSLILPRNLENLISLIFPHLGPSSSND
jgi:hypothetical protein